MSQENVELVQAWFERWNGGERDFPSDELLHPDFPPGGCLPWVELVRD
jgi:hypothetical protein